MAAGWCRRACAAALGIGCWLASAQLAADGPAERLPTATPIKYLVVLYLGNASFDSYFGTYPNALNEDGAPRFEARSGTPSVNGLNTTLLKANPNQSNPFRIGRLDSFTCDAAHGYRDELLARNRALLNRFVEHGPNQPSLYRSLRETAGLESAYCHRNDDGNYDPEMGYFDGNTVTALWNYAQHYAMSDRFFATFAGNSTRGHLALVAGDVVGAICRPADDQAVYALHEALPICGGPAATTADPPPRSAAHGTLLHNADPYYDVCSEEDQTVALEGRNIGDLLTDADVTWGWFQGGFGDCTAAHPKIAYNLANGIDPETDPIRIPDYVAHHNPFQYFRSTANPEHLPPSSIDMVGYTDRAKHQYDLELFWQAADRGALPAVSFLKPPAYQDGQPGVSTPLDQQVFIVETLNRLQLLPQWRRMAVILAWDGADGWYDHAMPQIVNSSATPLDMDADGQGLCGEETHGAGTRCAYGPRIPFLIVSPFARENFVSKRLGDQTSILRFIQDNWLDGERISETSFDHRAGSLLGMFDFAKGRHVRRVLLDPYSGQPLERPTRTSAAR